ncbi:hypothetical protein KAM380_078700 [Aeromonas caviae]|jgi:hypothetical protein|nr:hypothetical protein KAM380_078700 [Aeromonas caviae]
MGKHALGDPFARTAGAANAHVPTLAGRRDRSKEWRSTDIEQPVLRWDAKCRYTGERREGYGSYRTFAVIRERQQWVD